MDSLIPNSRQALASSPATVGRRERVLVACTALAALLGWPLSGTAQEAAPLADEGAIVGDVQIVQPSATDRHVELRRALLSDDEFEGNGRERRRLTPEERTELHRRLRDALRSAYGERTRSQQTTAAP